MQTNNLFNSPSPVAPAAPFPQTSKATTPPYVAFMPGAHETSDKKQFIKTIIISTLAFTLLSVIVFAFILSNQLSPNTSSTTSLKPIYRDGATATAQVITRRTITPTSIASTRVPTPTTVIRHVTASPTPAGQGAAVRIITPSPTPHFLFIMTPTPTSSIVNYQLSITPTPPISLSPTSSPTPSPTPYLYLSVESNGNSVNFGSQLVGSNSEQEVTMRNVGGSAITINTMFFSTTGGINPYSILNGNDSCLTNAELPYTLQPNTSRCLDFQIFTYFK